MITIGRGIKFRHPVKTKEAMPSEANQKNSLVSGTP